MRYDLGPGDKHAALAFQRLHFLPALLKEDLRREGLWEDLIHEVYTAALEAWKKEMDDRQTLRHTAKCLYRFLNAYGYCRNGRKDQSHLRRELSYSVVFPWDVGDKGLPEHPFGPRHSPGGDGGASDHERVVRVLLQEFPQQQDDLKQIAEVYLLARYGQRPTSQEEFHRVKKAWQRTVACHTRSRVRG